MRRHGRHSPQGTGKQRKPGVGDKENEDNSGFMDEDRLERTASAAKDAHGRKDGSRKYKVGTMGLITGENMMVEGGAKNGSPPQRLKRPQRERLDRWC